MRMEEKVHRRKGGVEGGPTPVTPEGIWDSLGFSACGNVENFCVRGTPCRTPRNMKRSDQNRGVCRSLLKIVACSGAELSCTEHVSDVGRKRQKKEEEKN